MNRKKYIAPEAEIENFIAIIDVVTTSPEPEGGLDDKDNIIDF